MGPTCQALSLDNPATQAGSRRDRKESKAQKEPTGGKLPLTRPRVSIIVHGLAATEALTLPELFLGYLAQVHQKESHMTVT